jgi:hypothetical protein
MCFLGVAEEGGQVLLSSAWTVYNEIAAKRPDVIDVLSRTDWVHDTSVPLPMSTLGPY